MTPARPSISTGLRTCLAAALLIVAVMPVRAAEIVRPRHVVELFTSQGCNSCPPADAVLETIVKRDDVLGLAWHVDYWDYLGWKDSFSLPEATARQRLYSAAMGRTGVYTPQAVVNGRAETVGSHESEVLRLIAENRLPVQIRASIERDTLSLDVPSTPESRGATLYSVYLLSQAEVPIERGENAGRTIRYVNVVRGMEMIGMVSDGPLRADFALATLGRRGSDGIALLLQARGQDGLPGPILGAVMVDW